MRRATGGPAGRGAEDSPGRRGASATIEIDPRRVRRVDISYRPRTDSRADPGEIVWTWVPFEEADGRGKDRPVLVVAAASDGSLLGLQLTSKPHDDQWDVAIGAGPWDAAGRPSWVRLERVFRLRQGGLRRSGVALPPEKYAVVARELTRRFGWTGTVPVPAAAAPRRGLLRRLVGRLFGRR
ncbi:type II toxin-antitoxin system PemK/MazF family toxin [Herbiconiux moechotypicola]|uniref:Type II toxin-antitoxin system PemK/MazF family toxin n=1 Tax=Herbiconiux moechotypicola TaxID=637393 RepID=A0ABN3DYR1_9MICO|nr:type II toxin-antitoxin system PemK/MazF family toxin [Herbiconiux moechotypicola]MCS5730859.1 type II toxin-antitoxin system PemK/MazF family toxin [Herbiconiux moechotypicola]